MSIKKSEINEKVEAEKRDVKIPMLFSVTARGVTHYLLFTNHVISLSKLPRQCMEVVRSCTSYVTELDTSDQIKFFKEAILRPKGSERWIDQLPWEMVQFLDKGITKFLEVYGAPSDLLGPPSDLVGRLDRLHIWAVHYFVRVGYANIIAGTLDNKSEESKSEAEVHSTYPGMDRELVHGIFKDTYSPGLETACSRIPGYQKDGSTIAELKELYELLKEMNKKQSIKQNQETAANENLKMLSQMLDDYQQAEYLVSSEYAIEGNEDAEIIDRNQRWLPKFSQLHDLSFPKGPKLFGVGAAHSGGEWGLLSLLPKEGYKLKRLGPNGTFEDYTYPFQAEIIYTRTLSQERLMVPRTRKVNEGLLMCQFDRFMKQKTIKSLPLNCKVEKQPVSSLDSVSLRVNKPKEPNSLDFKYSI